MDRILIEKFGRDNFKIETMIIPKSNGMHVPSMSHGVRVTYIPTGLYCDSKLEMSAGKNMAKAFHDLLNILQS
jgi:protein subunit release factor A